MGSRLPKKPKERLRSQFLAKKEPGAGSHTLILALFEAFWLLALFGAFWLPALFSFHAELQLQTAERTRELKSPQLLSIKTNVICFVPSFKPGEPAPKRAKRAAPLSIFGKKEPGATAPFLLLKKSQKEPKKSRNSCSRGFLFGSRAALAPWSDFRSQLPRLAFFLLLLFFSLLFF